MSRGNFLLNKAYRNYRKWCDDNGYAFMQHSIDNSGCENHEGKEYVILRNNSDILSVWLVGDGDRLSSIDYEDYPESLQKEFDYCNG